MSRIIPATMATQHPDNAKIPYFLNKKFVNTLDEVEEAYRMFSELKCTEYMWDWEGKHVDEGVIERLFQSHYEFFKKKKLGKEIFLTFRIPNIDEEKGYKLARSMMNILTADDIAHDARLHAPPIFEVILPMTKKASQLIRVKKTFHQVEQFKKEAFHTKRKDEHEFHVIPLIEGCDDLMKSDKLLSEYIEACKKEFGKKPPYMRPFMARSDPALNAGLFPAVMSIKAAIHKFYETGEKYGVPMYPIIGPGCLPFRGGMNPETMDDFMKQYAGVRTVTLQSSFRYDYPLNQVKKTIQKIEKTLPKLTPQKVSDKQMKDVRWVNKVFGGFYQKTVEKIAPVVNRVAEHVPSRRERMLHIGLFGYSRGIGKVTLPRAIKFTSSLYSLGIPPEFIGSGRGLAEARKEGKLKTIEELYLSIKEDLTHAGKYLNKENLNDLAKKYPAFKAIQEDVKWIEDYLGVELKPLRTKHKIHRNLVSSVYLHLMDNEEFDDELEKAAEIRKSLG